LNQSEQTELMRIYEYGDFRLANWDEQGNLEAFDGAVDQHITNILNCDWMDLDQTRARSLRVAIDCCNGAGSEISPRLLRELGCEVIELNCIPDGYFPRPAEPTPDALDGLCQAVRSEGADIGFAHDIDADRLVTVADGGVPLSSEYTFALAAEFLLSKCKGDLVATVSTSRILDDIADWHGVKLHRTPVGVGFVVEKMRETGAVIGGEGTGGVIYPELQYTTDGMASIAVIIQLLADSSESTISELVATMPSYAICKKKLEVPSQEIADAAVKLAHQTYGSESAALRQQGALLDLTDGVKRVWKDRWVNIRKSGTEPVIRVFSEAHTTEQAETLCDSTLDTLRNLIKHVTS
jgi:phosphomannomutase